MKMASGQNGGSAGGNASLNHNGGMGNHQNQIIHIRENSDSELQALFDSVLKPSANRPQQVPLRLRKLPDSFFNPPSTGSKSPSVSVNHSRENSVDSTLNSIRRSPFSATNGMGPAGHSRAHSSPASLEQTYSVANVQCHTGPPLGAAPPQSGSSGNLTDEPLPEGWEQAVTPQGQIYFINHTTRSTTWEDPRKAQHRQILSAVGGGTGAAGSTPTQQQNHAAVAAPPIPPPTTTMLSQGLSPAIGPLPDGWEQRTTDEGEVYFINHHNRTTSWFDPRIPVHLQRPPVLQQQINAAALAQSVFNTSGNCQDAGTLAMLQQTAQQRQQQQQQIRIQQLKLEAEKLRMRNHEIQQREKEQAKLRQQQRLGQTVMDDGVELDPFLPGSIVKPTIPSSNTDYHSRQESGDSGLGMATSYSLPNTPEDFLSTMDDNMDTISENDLGGGASIDAPDIASLDDNVESTDDLVPSLQLEELPNEILLDEMQSIINSKSDNTMTWL